MLIAFEGIDGSGKATQARKLYNKLVEDLAPGENVFFHSFPRYDLTVFGPHVKRYLRGEFGALKSVDPFLSSLLYSIDRYECRDALRCHLTGTRQIVVCDRYVASNVAHQGAKVPYWTKLARQIEQVEYEVFNLPRPDMVILLDLKASESRARTYARDGDGDIHQDDSTYMGRVRDVYLEMASTYRGWHVVKCFDADDASRGVDELHDEIWEIVQTALHPQQSTKVPCV